MGKGKAKAREAGIDVLLKEKKVYPPSQSFSRLAHVKSFAELKKLRKQALASPEKFWESQARELFWHKPWKKTLAWKPPFSKWFVGGKINASYNALDRHLGGFRRHKAALIWEGENGERKVLTYLELYREVCRAANALKNLGIKKGDRVAIYMPMVPEAVIAMLACSRIGAPHNVVFAGFSASALSERIQDAQAKLVITADGFFRKGLIVKPKDVVDEALKTASSVEKVLVLNRGIVENSSWIQGRDVDWSEALSEASDDSPAEKLDSEHPLFILYTSGSTGKPKGILHTTGGYLVQAAWTTKHVFDLKDDDLFWCTADIGWVTGHSYVVYGPLLNGATIFMYEGSPMHPVPDRFWSMIERHKISILYTAPTAIRAFMRLGESWPKKHDLSSLRLLGSVGEPINPEAWQWYHKNIGRGKCPIVDTWWQTETGSIMISPLPGATGTKPGSASLPLPGIDAEVVDKSGNPVRPGTGGYLVIKKPWPGMLRTIYGNPARYKEQYFSQVHSADKKSHPYYFTGDGARKDKDGYFWVLGRIDDVLNVSGHRLSTMEIESALVSHPAVAEAAVVGRPDNLTGQAVSAFVTLKDGQNPDESLKREISEYVGRTISPIAKPADIRFTPLLPKTRSGKIMRRLLREIASGGAVKGDITTLEDLGALEKLQNQEEE